ncbi:MAG: universal stress protein [Steroidobacteraceae bacterium]
MEKLTSILVVVERGATHHHALRKACVLARHFGARLELFLCDAEHAYALRHSYDRHGVAEARNACIGDARLFLDALRKSLGAADIDIQLDAACESPLHEGIVHKVLRSRPDMVVKSLGPFLTAADWHLIRTCPTPLMLARGNTWQPQPKFAAAVDVSDEETPGLARSIVHTGEYLSLGCSGALEILHGARLHVPESTRVALSELAVQFRVPPEGVHLLEGEPAKTLPHFAAERQYDVVVMGALTHRQAFTALVGTLTGTLVDSLACDIVFIKPATFACPLAAAPPARREAGDTPRPASRIPNGARA